MLYPTSLIPRLRRPADGHELTTVYSAAVLRVKPLLMRSFMMLLGRKISTRRGVIGTSSPVFGLRPMRRPLSLTPKDPNEDSFTFSPRDRVTEISLNTSSTSSCDSLRGR